MSNEQILPLRLASLQRVALAIGIVLVGGLLANGFVLHNPGFWQPYLIGFLYALGAGLGGLALLCIIHLAGGAWSHNVRRICEAAAMTILPVGLFFLPVLFNKAALYPWAHPTVVDAHYILVEKIERYLNEPFFNVRFFSYFLIWGACAIAFRHWSLKQDETGKPIYRERMKFLAGPALLLYSITLTGAAVDWVMSIEPMWFSSIFGVIFFVGQFLTILSFSLVFLVWLSKFEPIKSSLTPDRLHSLGKLQFAAVILWAYMEVSQFIIIWSTDLPEEITWYMNRAYGPFKILTAVLVLAQFFLPFLLLLNRHSKRAKSVIFNIAAALLVVRIVDLYWIVAPSVHEPMTSGEMYFGITPASKGPIFGVWDVLGPIGFGALWFGMFLHFFRKAPILPVRDPAFSDLFEKERKAAA